MEDFLKTEDLSNVTEEIVDIVINAALNSPKGIMLIYHNIVYKPITSDITVTVNKIDEKLTTNDFDNYFSEINETTFTDLLSPKTYLYLREGFFQYYFGRLPLLFSFNTVDKKSISKREMDRFTSRCIYKWAGKDANDDYYKKLYKKNEESKKHIGVLSSIQRREDYIYKFDWLYKIFDLHLPYLCTQNNAAHLFLHVIEGSFPMFWNAVQKSYGKLIYEYGLQKRYFSKDADGNSV